MRIRVARAARRHPLLLDMLRDGRLHLSAIVRLLPVLTRENRDALLARATFCSKRQILEIVAELSPRPDVPARMRKLPQQRHALLPTVAHQALPAGPALAPSAGVIPNSPSVGVPPSQAGVDAPVRRAEAHLQPDRAGVQRADRLCPDTVAAASAPALSLFAEACGGIVEPDATYGRRTPVARPLQGPVHRQRRAPRQARAAAGALAFPGPRWRPRRGHRPRRQRGARAARGPPLREDERSSQGALGHEHRPGFAPRAGGRTACRARAGRGSLRLRRQERSALLRAGPARVPPPASLRHGRRPRSGKRRPALPGAQPAAGAQRLRPARDDPTQQAAGRGIAP